MADNVELDSGSGGATIAADDISSVWHQRVKVSIGADGSAADMAATNPLPIGANTVKDGSGTVYAPLVDADAHLQIDVLSCASHAVTNAGTFVVQIDGAALTALQLIDDAVAAEGEALGKGVLLQGDDGTDRTNVLVDTDGHVQVDVVAALPAGSATIGNVGMAPQTSGGLSFFKSIDLDESEEEAKGSAGQVFGWYIHNNASAVRYVKFYNVLAAGVTVGTTVPDLTIPVPANSAANVEFTNGIAFSTAITVAATTGVADNDAGAPAANDVQIALFYK